MYREGGGALSAKPGKYLILFISELKSLQTLYLGMLHLNLSISVQSDVNVWPSFCDLATSFLYLSWALLTHLNNYILICVEGGKEKQFIFLYSDRWAIKN